MRVASIVGPTLPDVKVQIQQALTVADVLELRFDYWQTLNIDEIKTLRAELTLPVIFTLRKTDQGGQCNMTEAQRLAWIEKLASLAPDYLDIETDVDLHFIQKLTAHSPNIKIIGSYHNFSETPSHLTELFSRINHPVFSCIKIATYARSICDTLRLMIFLQQFRDQHQLMVMAMGEYGEASRILAPVLGSIFVYGSLTPESATAPRQLTLAELTDIYRVQQLNRDTKIYALLGDPVAHSQGHRFHNHVFQSQNRNAVYVKLKISPEDLQSAMNLLRQLPFAGFSVTMPHKETIVPLLDHLEGDAQATQIVNTIKNIDSQYWGYNTDGTAGAEILQQALKSLKQVPILILGAGGSAQAIAYCLIQRGAHVTICNRTVAKAKKVCQRLGCDFISFAELFQQTSLPYIVIVNTLPAAAFSAQCQAWTLPQAQGQQVAMDIVYQPTPTLFLQKANAAKWECITGNNLFVEQAIRQSKIWLKAG
ncbi:MAG: shikimate dehydrogenase [Gammaproteobacteria bacterium]